MSWPFAINSKFNLYCRPLPAQPLSFSIFCVSSCYRSVDISPTRLHSLAQHFRNRSSSLESQGKLLVSDPDTHPHNLGTLGSPDFFLGPGRSSNGSDPLDDCSSCTSQSSSEHYYPSGGPLAPGSNPNYSTLGEDSPSKARQRQRQRHR